VSGAYNLCESTVPIFGLDGVQQQVTNPTVGFSVPFVNLSSIFKSKLAKGPKSGMAAKRWYGGAEFNKPGNEIRSYPVVQVVRPSRSNVKDFVLASHDEQNVMGWTLNCLDVSVLANIIVRGFRENQ
jgi:hypothetical protein